MANDFPNVNALWAAVLAETLFRKGVRHAALCPGSRNSPLTFALAEHEGIETVSVLDERSAGFFALGLARRTKRPVALVCTSGSALANLYPAVVEASESGAPLVALTADRPQELRDCRAGQTIDQVKFFGSYARRYTELALPESKIAMLRYLRQAVGNAVDSALSPKTGPVQINVPLRDPLAPVVDPEFVSPIQESDLGAFFDGSCRMPRKKARSVSLEDMPFFQSSRGMIVVGPCIAAEEEHWARAVVALGERLNWPILADALNPLRSRGDLSKALISGYEHPLRSESAKAALTPEKVMVIGELPTSKSLREWFSELDCEMLFLRDTMENADPTHSRSSTVLCDLEVDTVIVPERDDAAYRKLWEKMEASVWSELNGRMEGCSALFEGKIAWSLAEALPEAATLSVSNSMPPRDLEFYYGKNQRGLSIYSSRGANGIDGILSAAVGVSHASGQPNYLLTGDLALLHDTNGALIAKQLQCSLTILLVNNSGGGIFEMLPVAQLGPAFETYWATDQDIEFADWARTYGFRHQLIESWDDFESALKESPVSGVRILEIRTDRRADAARRKLWFQEIAASLENESPRAPEA